jgi:hypothetical protein
MSSNNSHPTALLPNFPQQYDINSVLMLRLRLETCAQADYIAAIFPSQGVTREMRNWRAKVLFVCKKGEEIEREREIIFHAASLSTLTLSASQQLTRSLS